MAASTGDTSWPWPLQFLLNQPQSRRVRLIVLVVSAPLWMYAVVAACVTLATEADSDAITVAKFVVCRALLYPLLFGAYMLAMKMDTHTSWRFWPLQILIAATFLALMYPLLLIFNSWTFSVPTPLQENFILELLHGHLQNALAPFRLWRLWLATSLELSEIYLLGLALMLALNSFLRYKVQESMTAEMHTKWLEARLGTLRDQIGPHFLFNALNTILAYIREAPDVAERMTVELGALLRQNLDSSGEEFVRVLNEMEFVERYLAIMKMRFGERLEVTCRVDPRALEFRVPAFLLLPLVENAVKHGISKLPGTNVIEINCDYADDQLTFKFSNTASQAAGPESDEGRKHIGLQNIRARILALYGERGSFEAGFKDPGRWVTSVVIPAQRA